MMCQGIIVRLSVESGNGRISGLDEYDGGIGESGACVV